MRLFSTTGKLAGISVSGLGLFALLTWAGVTYTPLSFWLIQLLAFALVLGR